MHYDKHLQQLQEKVALKKQLEEQLAELRRQWQHYDRKVTELNASYSTEQEDVEKLEGRSLAKYFYQVIGKLEDKLDTERSEAAAARVKLDAAKRELDGIHYDMEQIRVQLWSMADCEQVYADALECKRTLVKQQGSLADSELLELERKIEAQNSKKREIREAVTAGKNAMQAAEMVLSELHSAENWNTWDLLGGGGLITHMAKHSHLDDAQTMVEQLQSKLRRFKTELADIHIQADMKVSVDGFLRFADYFFDGLFADWAVGDRITEAEASVRQVKSQIQSAMDRLENMDKEADGSIRNLQSEIENILIRAE